MNNPSVASSLSPILNDLSWIIQTPSPTDGGPHPVTADDLRRWFDFLGGKPGEVMLLDTSGDWAVQAQYWDLFQAGLIDKLQLGQTRPNPSSETRLPLQDSSQSIQTYTAASLANKSYLLWANGTLCPQRQGHEHWLAEAIAYLSQPGMAALTVGVETLKDGNPVGQSAAGQPPADWGYSRQWDLNFTVMTRSLFMAALHHYADAYIVSGFTTENPAAAVGQPDALVELALEHYLQTHQLYTLCRVEDASWSIQSRVPVSV